MITSTRRATYLDVLLILTYLREEDRDEYRAGGVGDPVSTLEDLCATAGDIQTFLIDGEPAVIYGVTPELGVPGATRIWMLHREGAQPPVREYLRLCRETIRRWSEDYPVLFNWKWDGNRHHLAWLERLGFQTIRHLRHNNALFHEFVRIT